MRLIVNQDESYNFLECIRGALECGLETVWVKLGMPKQDAERLLKTYVPNNPITIVFNQGLELESHLQSARATGEKI